MRRSTEYKRCTWCRLELRLYSRGDLFTKCRLYEVIHCITVYKMKIIITIDTSQSGQVKRVNFTLIQINNNYRVLH